ncbi:MAG: serine--tRNA ligase [Alphaproteobacteria bacterium]|nr:serine--tRNA ligase [Alphaproteobacteria bacterium]
MHDLKWIREQPAVFDAGLARRGLSAASAQILALDAQRRNRQGERQEIETRRNQLSREIGQARATGTDAAALQAEVARLKDRLRAAEEAERALDPEIETLLATLPNHLADDVPDGRSPEENVEVRRIGAPRAFAFTPKSHWDVGEGLGQMDFERAAKLSGARFVVLSGGLARLSRALAAFMLDLHTAEHGYREVQTPTLVRDQALIGTGQLPKFAADLFRTTAGLWLIPTAEVTLTNLVADEIVAADRVPLRMAAYTECFRSEAGAAGKDTRGMIRQHQFGKVELVHICAPEHSPAEHDHLVGAAETVLKRLGLPFRTMLLGAGDTGFGARKTYDIEVWLPGQDAYREISSCSDCGDFQARRMRARLRVKGEKGTRFVHTLNGSGVAVGRALIAVIENYQEADGSITVPDALRPYMSGRTRIEPGS